jgi:hypothetical protein
LQQFDQVSDFILKDKLRELAMIPANFRNVDPIAANASADAITVTATGEPNQAMAVATERSQKILEHACANRSFVLCCRILVFSSPEESSNPSVQGEV